MSAKGRAVFDYIIAALKCILFYKYIKVHPATDLMSEIYEESDTILGHSLQECIFISMNTLRFI